MSEQPAIIADSPRPDARPRGALGNPAARRYAIAGAVLLGVAAAAALLWLAHRERPESAPTNPAPVAGEPATAPAGAAPSPQEGGAVPRRNGGGSDAQTAQAGASCPALPAGLDAPPPPLPDSDGFVRERLGCVGALAPLWLRQPDLARRAAVLLDNAKSGKLPRRQVAFMASPHAFKALERDGALFVDPASWRRYDAVIDALTCLPPQQAAALASVFEPLLIDALAELGVAVTATEAHLHAALAQVEAIPMPPGFLPITQEKVLYEYADPELEALPPLQKQLLRLGPANLARLKDYAREVRQALRRQASGSCPAG